MLVLTNPGTADLISIITGSSSALDVHATHIDATTASPPVPAAPSRTNTAISSAATTTVVAGPASGSVRNVKTLHARNKGAANNDVTVNHNIGGTLCELFKATLRPGDHLEYVEGVGFFVVSAIAPLVNRSVASQGPITTAETYLTGSNIAIPAGLPVVGTMYHAKFDIAKTAGTAACSVQVKYGTNGTTGDTTRASFTFGVGTSVNDTALFEVWALFRTVGSGTSAVIQGRGMIQPNLAATGYGGTTPIRTVQNTGGGFDSTVANSIIGLSFTGGTAHSGTLQLVEAELVQS